MTSLMQNLYLDKIKNKEYSINAGIQNISDDK